MNRYKKIFEQILKMSTDGFIVVDSEGRLIHINKQYADFFGIAIDEAIGKPVLEVIPNSKMMEVVKNRYMDEDAIHTHVVGEAKGKTVIASRSYVEDDNGNIIAGVAQVKFKIQSLEVARKLMNEYSELEYYREQHQNLEYVIGSNPTFISKLNEAIRIAKKDFSVLITGETGVGKEVFAKTIHNHSDRREKPLVSINCAAIPAELLESELFGYTEGAFTGAKRAGKKGKFLIANGGTIFLDEIGDMPLSMQVKLLRVLQEREIEPVGGEKPIPLDVRVIAATRQNLEDKIADGTFREDLYYRINVVNIEVPPLRKRGNDVLELAQSFLNRLNEKYKSFVTLSPEVEECFLYYCWPGNVRELNNVIENAYALSEDAMIGMDDLPSKMFKEMIHGDNNGFVKQTLQEQMDNYEKQLLTEMLRRNHWNCAKTAAEAGIHRSAIYRKIQKYGLKEFPEDS